MAPHDIVTAACSTEWNWLKKTNQPEVAVAVLAKVAAAVVVWWQLPSCNIIMAACSAEWNWLGKTTKNNQLEVAATVVAKVAAAVVAWWQLPCDIIAAACSAEWEVAEERRKKINRAG